MVLLAYDSSYKTRVFVGVPNNSAPFMVDDNVIDHVVPLVPECAEVGKFPHRFIDNYVVFLYTCSCSFLFHLLRILLLYVRVSLSLFWSEHSLVH